MGGFGLDLDIYVSNPCGTLDNVRKLQQYCTSLLGRRVYDDFDKAEETMRLLQLLEIMRSHHVIMPHVVAIPWRWASVE